MTLWVYKYAVQNCVDDRSKYKFSHFMEEMAFGQVLLFAKLDRF